jgi:hypothetical protein
MIPLNLPVQLHLFEPSSTQATPSPEILQRLHPLLIQLLTESVCDAQPATELCPAVEADDDE